MSLPPGRTDYSAQRMLHLAGYSSHSASEADPPGIDRLSLRMPKRGQDLALRGSIASPDEC